MTFQPQRLIGIVSRTRAESKLQKTITVTVSRKLMHPKLLKEMNRSKKYLVHDEAESATLGDRVEIQLGRPLSARKRFFLDKIISSTSTSASHPNSSSVSSSTPTTHPKRTFSPNTLNSQNTPSSTHPDNSETPSISSLATAFLSSPIIPEDALPDAKVEDEKERMREEGRRRMREAAGRLGVEV